MHEPFKLAFERADFTKGLRKQLWDNGGGCVGGGVGGMGDGESIWGRWEVLAGTLDAGNAWLGNATFAWLTMALAP